MPTNFDKIDQLTIGGQSYDIDLPVDAQPSIASLTTSGDVTIGGNLHYRPNGTAELIDGNKLNIAYLPDSILGQLIYGGSVTGAGVATLSTNAKTRLGTTSTTIALTNDTTAITGYVANEGIYYIASNDGDFASLGLQTGDWLISTGSDWKKIDNTDAVTSVNGETGAVVLKLKSETTSDTGRIAYLDGISQSAITTSEVEVASKTHTHTYDKATGVSLTENSSTADGRITYVKSISGGSGSLTTDSSSTNGIAYIESASHTPASLGNATTGTVGISGGSYSGTTKYMKATGTAADTGTVTISGGSGSLTSDTSSSGGTKYVEEIGLTPASLGSPSTSNAAPSGHTHTSTVTGSRSTSGSGTGARRTLTLSGGTSGANSGTAVAAVTGYGSFSGGSLSPTTKYLHHSHTGATLGGTTTFVTNGIKAVELSASSTSTDGPAYTQSISGSAPSLTGDKTFVTAYPDFSGGSLSPTTKYLHHTHTGASATTKYLSAAVSTTSTNSGTPSASTTVAAGINGGVVTATTKYLYLDGNNGDQPAGGLTPFAVGDNITANQTIFQLAVGMDITDILSRFTYSGGGTTCDLVTGDLRNFVVAKRIQDGDDVSYQLVVSTDDVPNGIVFDSKIGWIAQGNVVSNRNRPVTFVSTEADWNGVIVGLENDNS